MSERTLQCAGSGGRELDVELSGPAEGRPLIFHNGTPMAGRMFAPMVAQGAERGVRHIAYSRPGYCGSERAAGRTVADCARDVAAIADELGIERFLTVGWSGGGPHALACAALLPERTLAAATLAGAAPINAPGLDWLAGMGEENIEEFGAARAGEAELSSYLRAERSQMLDSSVEDLHATLGDLLSDVDRDRLLRPPARRADRRRRLTLRSARSRRGARRSRGPWPRRSALRRARRRGSPPARPRMWRAG